MTNSIETQSDTISPGNIKFYDSIQPPLPAAVYTLQAQQTIDGLEEGSVDPYLATQPFRVIAPQFNIDPSLIHSVYPPQGHTGNYYKQLPFIVFNNFALPWARGIDPNKPDADEGTPWMAVLLVYEADMQGTDPKVGNYDPTTKQWIGPTTVAATDVIKPQSGVIVPDISASDISDGPDQQATVLEMKLNYFQAIAPTLDELPLLAHGRGVNTDGKIMLGMDADGLFSVVVSNRVPPTNGGKCTAFLISLEGHVSSLPTGTGSPSTENTKIRLVVLGSWSFTASQSPGSFRQLMINVAKQGGGVQLLNAPGDLSSITDETARKALEIGYVALQNDMRIGEKTTSWYRGPCVPAPTKEDTTNAPYDYSDHAIHYDPETGLFDMAYASAWQIGRLLALSDGAFSKTLGNWRRSYLQAQQTAADQREISAVLDRPLGLDTAIETLENTATKSPVSQLRNFMYQIGTSETPVFPQINIRSPLSSSTQPLSENDEIGLAAEEDPLINLLAHCREQEEAER